MFYLVAFLMGYFIFAHEKVQELLGRCWIALLVCAAAAGIILAVLVYLSDMFAPLKIGLAIAAGSKAGPATKRFADYVVRYVTTQT